MGQRWPLEVGNNTCNFQRCGCHANVRRFRGSAANLSVILVELSLGVDVRTRVPMLGADNNRYPNSVTVHSGRLGIVNTLPLSLQTTESKTLGNGVRLVGE